MIEPSQIIDPVNWPLWAALAAWLGTKARAAWHNAFELAEYFQHSGGLLRWLGRILWNGGNQ